MLKKRKSYFGKTRGKALISRPLRHGIFRPVSKPKFETNLYKSEGIIGLMSKIFNEKKLKFDTSKGDFEHVVWQRPEVRRELEAAFQSALFEGIDADRTALMDLITKHNLARLTVCLAEKGEEDVTGKMHEIAALLLKRAEKISNASHGILPIMRRNNAFRPAKNDYRMLILENAMDSCNNILTPYMGHVAIAMRSLR